MCFRIIAFVFFSLNCFLGSFTSAQQGTLPDDEVQVLQSISSKLKIDYWTVSPSSCNDGSLNRTVVPDDILSGVTCACNNTVCHVTNIQLKGLSLTGVLPEEFANLTRLTELELTRNYFNGSIPLAITRIPLTFLSLIGNRISGPIPKEIGNIATLEHLLLEDNQLEGPLPEEIGNLSNLKRLLLSANNFTGTIPESFSKLRNLTNFRIDGSSMTGRIPAFIGNWTLMERLDLQGTGMDGPIPSTIELLKNLKELRITGLTGSTLAFPNLTDMKSLERLSLRNSSIVGPIPNSIGELTLLKSLDLSYNQLNGPIPQTFQDLTGINYMFLGHNSLSGEIPVWILNSNENIDVSYNNFTAPSTLSCTSSNVNKVSSLSTSVNSNSWCAQRDLSCSDDPINYSLFINCGGDRITIDRNIYEEDTTNEGPSHFYASGQRWAYSSGGVYMDNTRAGYIATNTFSLNITGPDFYRTARVAPDWLKYYGLCLREGSYKVHLHFAEIMFSDDETFNSLGERIFDVAIQCELLLLVFRMGFSVTECGAYVLVMQGIVVLTDFNIMTNASGVGRGITIEFNDVLVNGSTLEIHLYWRGKGTTAIPDTVVLLIILFVLRKKGYLGGRSDEEKELRALDLQTGYFSLRQIKAATNNFDPANKIGEGGFGPVYKGVLSDGSVIAVKQLSAKSKQGNREFVNEIGMISALQHQNLVKLHGCCIEGNQLLLIYEYMENNSLARALFGKEEQRLNLDWPTRMKICVGIAKGLAYLHEESRLKIVHRDIKATNVLLDKDLNAKISDFGLAKLDEDDNTHISTRIAGTIGYMAPEYAMRGYLTDKADIYSFGVVALEIVSGKSNTNYRPKEEFVYLLDWAYVLQEQGSLLELVDPSLGSNYPKKEVMRMLNLSLLCTNPSPTLRPSMSSVVKMLEGKIPVQAPLIKRGEGNEEMRFKAFELLSHDSQTHVSSSTVSQESQVIKSSSIDGQWVDSLVSDPMDESLYPSSSSKLLPDLYDVKLD
ncbi:hypothetical protein Leryth_022224 [Lithospermum erythrorhizon]|nr:hypothetical protein Leryth_022224 [Lithospermum erythrorhizon]